MEYYDLIGHIRDGLAASADLVLWCKARWDKAPTLYVEHELDNPPPTSEYPVIVIMADGQERNVTVDHGNMLVSIGFGIEEDTRAASTVSVPGAGSVAVYEYEGIERVLEFRRKAEDVLFSLVGDRLGGAWITGADELVEADYPYFRCVVEYTFKNPNRFEPFRIG